MGKVGRVGEWTRGTRVKPLELLERVGSGGAVEDVGLAGAIAGQGVMGGLGVIEGLRVMEWP